MELITCDFEGKYSSDTCIRIQLEMQWEDAITSKDFGNFDKENFKTDYGADSNDDNETNNYESYADGENE